MICFVARKPRGLRVVQRLQKSNPGTHGALGQQDLVCQTGSVFPEDPNSASEIPIALEEKWFRALPTHVYEACWSTSELPHQCTRHLQSSSRWSSEKLISAPDLPSLYLILSFRVRTFPKESHLGHDTVRALMYYALKVWSDITPLNFHEVAGNNADIQIDFSKADHNDGYPFDGPGGTVAHAFFPGDHHTAGDTHFDDDEYWTFRSSGTFPSPSCRPWLFWDLEGCRRVCDYGSSQMGAAFSHFSVIWVASLPHASVFCF